jgi:hypothetical protein
MKTGFIDPMLVVLLIVLVLLTVFGIIYLYISTKSKERLALIEKGMDPNLAKSYFLTQLAIIGIGFSVGLIVGDYLPTKYGYGPLVGILFAGVGLVLFNMDRKKNNQKKSL